MGIHRRRRVYRYERLERRQLLAGDTVHNFLAPLDVNDDQVVSPLDALAVVNHLNRDIDQSLQTLRDTATQLSNQFLDVNDDSMVTVIDALQVINGLNRDIADSVDEVFSQLSTVDGVRMRADFVRDAVTGLEDGVRELFQVRLQHGTPGREYPIVFDGNLIGTVVADRVGRGVFEIVSDSLGDRPLLDRIVDRIDRVVESRGLLHVEGIGAVILNNLESNSQEQIIDDASRNGSDSSSDEAIRIPDFGMLPDLDQITGPVFSTVLREAGRIVGGAYLTSLQDGFSLGLVARGFEPGEVYEVAVDGVSILSVEAGRYGVISMLYNSLEANADPLLNPLPEVLEGSQISLRSSQTTVSVTGDLNLLELPFLNRSEDQPGEATGIIDRIESTLIATLDGNGVNGLVTYTPRGTGYYLGIAVRGAARRETFEVMIDGVSVATVRSNLLGLIVFRQTSEDGQADGFPLVTENSVVEIVGLGSGNFVTTEDTLRELLDL